MFTQLISGNYCLHCYKQHNNNDNEKVNELTVSPQVHVSVKPVAENIGAGTSRATAHNYDNYSLDWKYVENQWKRKGCERHDAKLAQETDKNAPWPADVYPELSCLDGAAHWKHDQGKHDGKCGTHHHVENVIERISRHQAGCARADGGIFRACGL